MSRLKREEDTRVQVHCELKHQTDKAWLIVFSEKGEDEECWVPKSLGDFVPESDDGVVGVLEVAKWFAMKEDLPH